MPRKVKLYPWRNTPAQRRAVYERFMDGWAVAMLTREMLGCPDCTSPQERMVIEDAIRAEIARRREAACKK